MKVFISWSGSTSKAVAEALSAWIPNVIQAVKPWISSDIEKGARWLADVGKQLEETKVGVICLTPDNLAAPWILFEAGALSKTLAKTHVCPYLFKVKQSDLEGPLVQFQTTQANQQDTKKLMRTLNKVLGEEALEKGILENALDKWWPNLEKNLTLITQNADSTQETKKPERTEMEILEEILALVRGINRGPEINFSTIGETVISPVSGIAINPTDPNIGAALGLTDPNILVNPQTSHPVVDDLGNEPKRKKARASKPKKRKKSS